MSQTVRAKELDGKSGAIYLVFHVSSFGVMVLKFPKIVHFLKTCADLRKKPNSVYIAL